MDYHLSGWQKALSVMTVSGSGQSVNHFIEASKVRENDFECGMFNGRKVFHVFMGIIKLIPVVGALIALVDSAAHGVFKSPKQPLPKVTYNANGQISEESRAARANQPGYDKFGNSAYSGL